MSGSLVLAAVLGVVAMGLIAVGLTLNEITICLAGGLSLMASFGVLRIKRCVSL